MIFYGIYLVVRISCLCCVVGWVPLLAFHKGVADDASYQNAMLESERVVYLNNIQIYYGRFFVYLLLLFLLFKFVIRLGLLI